MIRNLLFLLIISPSFVFAQLTDDFEDGDISDWTQSTDGRWAASDISPINGTYSLHHIYDNASGDNEQVSIALPVMDITSQNTAWRFKIKYRYNPSGGNNWSVFLMSNAGANQMHPSGNADGYALGVNYTGSDDTLRLYRITSGSSSVVTSTTLNWDDDLFPSDIIALEVIRTNAGEWEVKYNIGGDFDNLQTIGNETDNTYTAADYFGLYYLYTSSADRNLWLDDIYIGEEIKDTISPGIDSLYIINSNTLKIEYTEQIDSAIASNLLHYAINGGMGNPDSVFIDELHQSAELHLKNKLTDGQQYSITIQNIEDLEGNVIQDTSINFVYEYIKPLHAEVISANELQVQFSRKPDTVSAEDILNYNLDNGIGNPVLADVVFDDSTKVHLQFSTDFTNKTYYELAMQHIADQNLDSLQTANISFLYFVPETYDVVINEIMADPYPEVNLPNEEYIEILNNTGFDIDLTGWKLISGTTEKDFPADTLKANGYLTLCPENIAGELANYGDVLGFPSFPSITNGGTTIKIVNKGGTEIDTVAFTIDWYQNTDKEDGGWSLERIDPLNFCSRLTNWKASENPDGGTPGFENSVFAPNQDTLPPQVEKIEILAPQQLRVYFNEPIEDASATNIDNYSVNQGIGNPLSAIPQDNNRVIELSFSDSFPEETRLTLTLENIADWCNNITPSTNINFIYFIGKPHDVLINEIMADPDPSINLPNEEYIEILNNTGFDIDLSGWKLISGTTEKNFPADTLKANGYLTLCPENIAGELANFGEVLGFPSFPSITNSGTTIKIVNKGGTEIDTVAFTIDWYQDPDKEDGGWSLERIDPLNFCSRLTNWKASENPDGGTPGFENSVFAPNQDTLPPQIEKLEIIASQQLRLYFNEPIEDVSATNIDNYSVNQGIGNPLSAIPQDNNRVIELSFSDSFPEETGLTLTIENTADWCNNIIPSTDIHFIYFVGKSHDMLINEIMADPDPSINLPNEEYIEILNNTEFDIDLTGWKLISGTTEKDFPADTLKANAYLTLCPENVADELANYGDVLGFPSFPSITNAGTTVKLKNNEGIVIDSVAFTIDWYQDPEKDDGGWSLERIDPLNFCSRLTNWKASENPDGGTPGFENSVFAPNQDTVPPQVEKIEVVDSQQLRVYFNEPIEDASATNIDNYSVNQGIGNPLSAIPQDNNRVIELSFSDSFPEETGLTLTIENTADWCTNITPSTDIHFIYFVGKPHDVLINEIMADPYPKVNLPNEEYIEIFNNTEFDIDLTGWNLISGTTEKNFPADTLKANAYLTLCPESAASDLANYGEVLGFPSFPSIANTGTTIKIVNKEGTKIDTVAFTIDWYQDHEKEDGGWSLERIDPLNFCSRLTNWKASENPDGGTPGFENSVFAPNQDTVPPQIEKLEIVASQQLRLYFNEPIDNATTTNIENFTVNQGIGNPYAVLRQNNDMEIDLLFLNPFPEKTELTLSIENLFDWCANIMPTTEFNFTYYVEQPFDVVINEIMADPEPVVELPEYEYIEIYNTSNFDIGLIGWTISAGSTVREIPSTIIKADEYIVLCSEDAGAELEAFGKTITVPGFPFLTNSGQTLILKNRDGKIISSVTYSDQWYKNEYKAGGGWSLEQMDPFNPCGEGENWEASKNDNGGTPGQINSIDSDNPDFESPDLLRAAVTDENTVQLFFSESIHPETAIIKANYRVDHGFGNPENAKITAPENKSVLLSFAQPFETNTIYEVEITGDITDCAGNVISNMNTARFAVPQTPEQFDLAINEILFNPFAGGVDFVEIYNRSDKIFDLNQIYMASYNDDEADYNSVEKASGEGYLIFPGEYLVITEKPEIIIEQYYTPNPEGFVQVSALPSYNNDKGRVIIMDKNENAIDNFAYTEDMHFALLASSKGVSLERINYERPTDDKTNWHSASEVAGFATPAYENSQYNAQISLDEKITIEPEIFSPDNDGYNDVTNISFNFDEPGYVANIKIYDARGRLVKYLANNLLLGINQTITWDGLDDKNQKAPMGVYVVLIELFDLDGNIKQYKKTVVVAAKLQ